jgi:hypothetical protein
MSRYSHSRRWVEAAIAAVGAGCAALAVQDEHARWQRQLVAFMAAALPVLAVAVRGHQAATAAAARAGHHARGPSYGAP